MKISLIVLGALSVTLLLRERSAAFRHWILAVALGCAAAMPLLEAALPRWHLPFPSPAVFEPYDNGPALPATVTGGVFVAPDRVANTLRQPAVAGTASVDVGSWLRWTWLAGTSAALLTMVVGLCRLTWFSRRARRVTDGRWLEIAGEMSREFGLATPPLLLESEHPSLLITWGLRQPKILLPSAAALWPVDRLRIVLSHELAHIVRRDWFVQLSGDVLRAFYWFNPLIWIACRRMRFESERACDDEVMSRGVEGVDYATHLVELARTLNRRHPLLPAPAMARPSSLQRRVRAMLNNRRDRRPITGVTRVMVGSALVVVATAIASAQSGFVSFTGRVADEQDRGIPNTVVTLSNDAKRSKYSVATGDDGRFALVGLTPGSYGLNIEGMGFEPVRDGVVIEGKDVLRNFVLRVGSLQETINVRFNANEVDSGTPAPRVREAKTPLTPRACTPSSVGGRIMPPLKIRDVSPIYPVALRGSGIEGTVVMEATIAADGHVSGVDLIGEAVPELAQAAEDAVRDWRFTETLLNCQPIGVRMTVTTTFRRETAARPGQ